MTALDDLFAAPDASEAAHMRFLAAVADTELFVLLEREANGDQIEPRVFPVETGPVVLAFDTEDRLAEFAEGPAEFAALPGRVLAQMLIGQGLGLGLNLGVAPSSTLLPADAMTWLVDTLAQDTRRAHEADIESCHPPKGVPEGLLDALAQRLSRAAGLASGAVLAEARYRGGATGHVLAVLDTEARAQDALTRMLQEALVFSGIEAGFLDITFLSSADPSAKQLSRVGLRLEIPEPEATATTSGAAPGMDPARPPKLR